MQTILLVDSDLDFRERTTAILRRRGYAVIPMQKASSAINAVAQGISMDIVITALQLEDMDGLEMLAAIKRIAHPIPMIVMSADPTIESYLKAISFGVFEYFNKPVKTGDLCGTIKNALAQMLPGIHRSDHAWQECFLPQQP